MSHNSTYFPKKRIDDSVQYLFVESAHVPEIIQKLLVLSRLICETNNMSPLICKSAELTPQTSDFANQYLSSFEILTETARSSFVVMKSILKAIVKRVFIYKQKDILRIEISGLILGPVIYDTYLGNYTKHSISLFDWRLVKTIFQAIYSFERISSNLEKSGIKGILLSHRVGMTGTIYSLLAAKMGIPVYSFGGDSRVALNKSTAPFSYVYKPTEKDMDKVNNFGVSTIDKLFAKAKEFHFANLISADTKYAYGGRVIETKDDFFTIMKIESRKEFIVFIAAHVPNDYPNGLGLNSSFTDYNDWLETTLAIARLNKNVFWVIKEHPMMKNYGFGKSYFEELEESFGAPNMYFLRCESNFSNKSLANVASVVITCNGSIGFEMPALFGVPSIYWNNSFYAEFNVGTAIDNLEQYKDLLLNLGSRSMSLYIDHKAAKACYSFVYWSSRIDLQINPLTTQEEMLTMHSEDSFSKRMEDLLDFYVSNKVAISEQEAEIRVQLKDVDFFALRSPDYLAGNP